MIRLLAFDLDGTTITEHKYLSPENRDALIRAGEKGVVLLPATGRMLKFVPEVVTSLPGVRYVLTSNGAAVYDLKTGEAVYQRLIPNEKARQVQSLLDGYDVYVEYYREGNAITKTGYPQLARTHFGFPQSKWHFVDGKDYALTEDLGRMLVETGLCPEKINLPYLKDGLRGEIWERLEQLGGLRLTSSIEDNIEINDAGADKGAAVLAMAERLGIGREEIFAIGDNGNDVTMLGSVGCSVAVADGAPAALAAAKHRTGPHDADGLAAAVKQFVLGEAPA